MPKTNKQTNKQKNPPVPRSSIFTATRERSLLPVKCASVDFSILLGTAYKRRSAERGAGARSFGLRVQLRKNLEISQLLWQELPPIRVLPSTGRTQRVALSRWSSKSKAASESTRETPLCLTICWQYQKRVETCLWFLDTLPGFELVTEAGWTRWKAKRASGRVVQYKRLVWRGPDVSRGNWAETDMDFDSGHVFCIFSTIGLLVSKTLYSFINLNMFCSFPQISQMKVSTLLSI